MPNSEQKNPLQLESQSARSQNFSEDMNFQDIEYSSKIFHEEQSFCELLSDPQIKQIHSSFLKSIWIVFTVVISVFLTLSIFAYLLVSYLNSAHSEHYFDVEPFESAHPLYNETNLFYTVRERFRLRTPPIDPQLDRYEFNSSTNELVQYAPFHTLDLKSEQEYEGIKKTALMRTVKLMELTHNVNFYGEFVFDHFNFYDSPSQKAHKFVELLTEERAYLNSKYQIEKFIHDQIGICVFVPSFNNARSRLYLRNLDSIFQQNYKNYHVVYVNDASTDGTGDYVKAYMQENEIPKQKYTIINNEESKLHCENIYIAAHKYCREGEILVMLDGDDSLIGRDVFALLNAVYQKEKIALSYGQFLLVKKGNFISGGWSRPIPKKPLENGEIRNLRTFYSSHLKTMYVDLFRKIKAADLQHKNGSFYRYSPDVAYMTPAIEMVGTRLSFINEANYQYRFDTGLNEPSAQQIIVTNEIYQREPYQRLQVMQFADNPKTVHYDVV